MINSTFKPSIFSLFHSQKRIWRAIKTESYSFMHTNYATIYIKEKVDLALLESAIQHCIHMNLGLRIQMVERNGELLQYVEDYKEDNIAFFDFSLSLDPTKDVMMWEVKQIERVMNIESSPLYYFALFKLNDEQYGYFVKFHSIIADVWSINLITEQIALVYTQLLLKETPSSQIEESYWQNIHKEQAYLSSNRFLKDKLFWNEKFKAFPEVFLQKKLGESPAKMLLFRANVEIAALIREFANKQQISMHSFFVAVFVLYLQKTMQQNDIVIGQPVLNRMNTRERSIVGMFSNLMPFRMHLDDESTIYDYLYTVNRELTQCFFHQQYPYDCLIQDLELNEKEYDQLFQVCLSYHQTKLDSGSKGLQYEMKEFHAANQLNSLQVTVTDCLDSGALTLNFAYETSVYCDEQIKEMIKRLDGLMHLLINNPANKIKELHLVLQDEREELIYRKNATQTNYPRHKTIYQLFEEQVELTPDNIAVEFEHKQLTYRQLNQRANQLARSLVRKGVTSNSIVGLMVKHSLELLVGIFGILKAGGAYVPIDPDYPLERIQYILKDSKAPLLLCNCVSEINFGYSGEIIHLDKVDLDREENENLQPLSGVNDLVYLIYTSGSTGSPKGAMIEHRGLVNYIWWAKEAYIRSEQDVFALYSSLAFDLTVTSVFTPLLSGNKVQIYYDDGDEFILHRILRDNRTHIIKLTPSHLSLLKDSEACGVVHTFIVGGEDLKVNLAQGICRKFNRNLVIYNEYGPTETVVGCMIDMFREGIDLEGSVPIGCPIDNVQLYILDQHLQPLPKGASGELYVSGDGVARGYLNRPELTQERFLPDPFVPGQRMYKTGDLARWRSDDRMEYLGRIDYQVKIRGHRIELGEIENQLLTFEAIEEAIVIDQEDRNGTKILCAYVKMNQELDPQVLREYLEKVLPHYMIPAYFIRTDEFPLTPNGKVDRNLLPKQGQMEAVETDSTEVKGDKEKQIVLIIQEVLNLNHIRMEDNFYHIGGDSIKAIQIASKLRENGFRIKVKDILSFPVMKELAAAVEEVKVVKHIQEQIPSIGEVGATPITSWFFAQPLRNKLHWNQSVVLVIKRQVRIEILNKALTALVQHHDALRLNVAPISQTLFYNPEHLVHPVVVKPYDLSAHPWDEQKRYMEQYGEQLKSDMEWEQGLLFKACLFNLGDNRGSRLLLTAHHLVVDAVSWRILLEDLATSMRQLDESTAIRFPSKTSSMQEWASRLVQYGKETSMEEYSHWNGVLDNQFSFPIDNPCGEDSLAATVELKETLSIEDTEFLLGSANRPYGTETNELLIIALGLAIHEQVGQNEIILELEGHGREEISDQVDVTRTVGWFTSIYPVKLVITDTDLAFQIKSIKEQLRCTPNKGIGYGILSYVSVGLSAPQQKQIRFNYLGEFEANLGGDYFGISDEYTGEECDNRNPLTCLLDIRAIVLQRVLTIHCTFSENIFNHETISVLLKNYFKYLQLILNLCRDKKDIDFTPSDFDSVNVSQHDLDELFSF